MFLDEMITLDIIPSAKTYHYLFQSQLRANDVSDLRMSLAHTVHCQDITTDRKICVRFVSGSFVRMCMSVNRWTWTALCKHFKLCARKVGLSYDTLPKVVFVHLSIRGHIAYTSINS